MKENMIEMGKPLASPSTSNLKSEGRPSGCIFIVQDTKGVIDGFSMANDRNLLALQAIYAEVIVVKHRPPRLITQKRWRRFILEIKQRVLPRSTDLFLSIIDLVEKYPGYHVFFSHSNLGVFVRALKRGYPRTLISVFFHNIESWRFCRMLKSERLIIAFPFILSYYISEKYICKYADHVFVLNSRDGILLKKIFHCPKVKMVEVPMSLVDRNVPCIQKEYEIHLWRLLFVGTYYWGNIPGLRSFIEDVMNKVSDIAELYVVGRGMDRLETEFGPLACVHYIGEVSQEELDTYYKKSDIFVAPITTGGGMKTKVAEAMMFGLPVIGTYEAFMGYDVDISKVGYCSDNISSYKDFIMEVTVDRLKSMSNYSRKFYKEYYSLNTTIEILRNVYGD